MPDSRTQRLFTQSQGWLASAEAFWDEAQQMAALELNGHPRAQDFEPTGKGGSDPTSVNGTKPDTAAADGREMRRCLERIWTESERLSVLVDKHRRAIRPQREPGFDPHDWCVLHFEAGAMEPRAHNDLCDPCYRFSCTHGRYPTVLEVEHYVTYMGKWPRQRIDPKAPMRQPLPKTNSQGREYIATTEALITGFDGIQQTDA